MRKLFLISTLLLSLFIISGCGNDDVNEANASANNNENNEQNEGAKEKKETKKKEEKKKEKKQSGAVILSEAMLEESEAKSNDNGLDFANKNSNIFIKHEEQSTEAINEPKFLKNPNAHGEQFVKFTGEVIEADEDEIADDVTVTYLQVVHDETHSVYQVTYDGSIEIYADDQITVEGLPVGVVRSKNMEGSYSDFPVLISNKLSK